MSEVLASLKKIGGSGEKYTETSLWTNSAPTSSFSAQAVTLSQSMADFKYLKIKVAPSTTSTSSQYFEDIILVSELQRTQPSAQEGIRDRLVLGYARTTYDYVRPYYYASNTSIYFMATAQTGTSTTNNNRNIPLEILGINELAHGEGVLATPFQLTLKSTVANGRSVTEFDKSAFPYTKFRVISKTNNLRYIGNGSWVTLAVGDIVDFSALPDTNLTIDVSGSTTSTASAIEFYN